MQEARNMAQTTLPKPARAKVSSRLAVKPHARSEREAAPSRAVPYDPDADVTASEPFDALEFIRLIHEERDAS